jgi:flagellar hook-length control protein FliK
MRAQLESGQGSIRIQLKPEHLGRVEIRAESAASGVVARIVAESSDVKRHLEANLHLLETSLRDHGLRVDRIEVALSDGFDAMRSGAGSQSGWSERGHHGGGAQASEPGGARRETDAPADVSEPVAATDPVVLPRRPNSTFHTIA